MQQVNNVFWPNVAGQPVKLARTSWQVVTCSTQRVCSMMHTRKRRWAFRKSRELRSNAECLDALLAGDFPHLGDMLIQRVKSRANGLGRGQLGFGAAPGIDSDVLQQSDVDQRNACCATHTNGAAQPRRKGRCVPQGFGQGGGRPTPSPRRPPLVSDAMRGIPLKSGAQMSMAPATQVWQVRQRISSCNPFKIFLSGEGSAQGTASQDLSSAPASCQESSAAASCQESTISEPCCQPCCQSGTPPSAARVSASRPRSSLGPASIDRRCSCCQQESASMGRIWTHRPNHGPRLRKGQKAWKGAGRVPADEHTASQATTQFLPHTLGSGAWPAQFAGSGEPTLSTPVGGKLASGSAAVAVRSRYNALPNRFSLRHQRQCFLGCHLNSVTRHVSTAGPA